MHRNCRRCSKLFVTYPSRCRNGNGGYCSAACKKLDTAQKNAAELTQAMLLELFLYDPDTGDFTWRINRYKNTKGKAAGRIDKKGYRYVEVNGKGYFAHRLIWFYHHGSFPPESMQIDHVNGIKNDNRISNLRLATQAQNQANRKAPPNRTSGVKGVGIKPNGLIFARISENNHQRHLGVYETVQEAKEAYDAEARRLRGKFARDD